MPCQLKHTIYGVLCILRGHRVIGRLGDGLQPRQHEQGQLVGGGAHLGRGDALGHGCASAVGIVDMGGSPMSGVDVVVGIGTECAQGLPQRCEMLGR